MWADRATSITGDATGVEAVWAVSVPSRSKASAPILVPVAAAFLSPVHAIVTVWVPAGRTPVSHTFCCHAVVALHRSTVTGPAPSSETLATP